MTSNMKPGLEGKGINPHLPQARKGDDSPQWVGSAHVWTAINIHFFLFGHLS
jgi:hypothetical protein